jgi:DNA-binding transcriptional MerR regulator
MVRKRAAWERFRDRFRRRRRTKPPAEGFLINDVARLSGVTVRTIRAMVERKLLAQPTFYGTKTRYSRDFVIRVLVVRALREKRLRGDAFDRAYRAMAAAELEALASATASPEAAVALKLHKPETATADATPKEPWQVATESGAWKYTVQVLPGLEIVIAKDASPLARRLARQFIADCVGKPDAG